MRHLLLLVTLSIYLVPETSGFLGLPHGRRVLLRRSAEIDESEAAPPVVQLASGGVTEQEFEKLLSALRGELADVVPPSHVGGAFVESAPITVDGMTGLSGRVCLVAGCGALDAALAAGDDEEDTVEGAAAEQLHYVMAEVVDGLVNDGSLSSGVVVRLEQEAPDAAAPPTADHLSEALRAHVVEYDLQTELGEEGGSSSGTKEVAAVAPDCLISIDGAWLEEEESALVRGDEEGRGEGFDTSSVAIFDGLVDETLRRKLLLLLTRGDGDNNNGWDPNKGPDPEVWAEGALDDTPVTGSSANDDEDGDDEAKEPVPSSWGLTTEHLERLCAEYDGDDGGTGDDDDDGDDDGDDDRSGGKPAAVAELEHLLQTRVWPGHRVCRLATEAMLGDVSPSFSSSAVFWSF